MILTPVIYLIGTCFVISAHECKNFRWFAFCNFTLNFLFFFLFRCSHPVPTFRIFLSFRFHQRFLFWRSPLFNYHNNFIQYPYLLRISFGDFVMQLSLIDRVTLIDLFFFVYIQFYCYYYYQLILMFYKVLAIYDFSQNKTNHSKCFFTKISNWRNFNNFV